MMRDSRFKRALTHLLMGVLVFIPGFGLFFLLESYLTSPASARTPVLFDAQQNLWIYLFVYIAAGALAGLLYGLICFLYGEKTKRDVPFSCHFFSFLFFLAFCFLLFLDITRLDMENTLAQIPAILGIILLSLAFAFLGRILQARFSRLSSVTFGLTWMILPLLLLLRILSGGSGMEEDREVEKTSKARAHHDRPNVCLITIDTLRADHLGCYGYERIDTRHIDGIAREGVFFTSAFCQIPVTRPSHTSMLTGKYPGIQGIMDNSTGVLDTSQLTLAEILSAQGYRTAAFVSALPLHGAFGLGQGFEVYDDRFSSLPADLLQKFRKQSRFRLPALLGRAIRLKTSQQRNACETTEPALKWLSRHYSEPFFLWVHYYDPHVTYDPPPPFDTMYPPADDRRPEPEVLRPADADYWIARYDGEITFTDRQVGRLLDALESWHVLDNTFLVLTSDHGESFEHGYYYQHTGKLYDTLIHIPLMIRFPPLIPGGEQVDALVESIDFLPTILEILELGPPEDISGVSMLPLLSGDGGEVARNMIFAGTDVEVEETRDKKNGRVSFPALRMRRPVWLGDETKQGGLRTIRTAQWKLILDQRKGTVELYDLEKDPGENRNLAGENEAEARALLERLKRWLLFLDQSGTPVTTIDLDEEMKQGLEALGYLY